jgi:zinc transport system substrate-binding protein
MDRRTWLKWLPIAALAGFTATGCQGRRSGQAWGDPDGKKKVLVTFAPLYSFAKAVAGDDANVRCLLTTTGPHTHGDATENQIELVRGCDLLIFNGLGLDDDLVESMKTQIGADRPSLDLGSKVDPKLLKEGACHHDHDHGEHNHDHDIDPHIWLSVPLVKIMVNAIRDELKQLDPSHAEGYDRRATAYNAKLDQLQVEGKAALKNKEERSIVSFHDSLNYFAECYGLTIAGSIQIDAGSEPTPKRLKELIKLCQKNQVRVIAVEPQFSRNTSARVVRDALRGGEKPIDAEFVEIDPFETCDQSELSADLYERKMRENIDQLAKVLR